jgi:hypothetical protein
LQFSLKCKYINCENYIIIFKDNYKDDPYNFKIYNYFLCKAKILKEIIVKVYPLIAKVKGVLCVDKGRI